MDEEDSLMVKHDRTEQQATVVTADVVLNDGRPQPRSWSASGTVD